MSKYKPLISSQLCMSQAESWHSAIFNLNRNSSIFSILVNKITGLNSGCHVFPETKRKHNACNSASMWCLKDANSQCWSRRKRNGLIKTDHITEHYSAQVKMHVENFLTEKYRIKLKPGSQASHAKEKNIALMPIFFLDLQEASTAWDFFLKVFSLKTFFLTAIRLRSQALMCLPPIAFKLIIFNIFGTADYTQTWPVSVRASHRLWNNHLLRLFKSYFLYSWSQFSTSDYSQHDLNYIIKLTFRSTSVNMNNLG